MQTDIKSELKECIRGLLAGTVSSFFLRRALGKIDEAETGRENLADACCKVAKMVHLFIDDRLAEEMMRALQLKIDQSGLR
jgi:hypothetical protein